MIVIARIWPSVTTVVRSHSGCASQSAAIESIMPHRPAQPRLLAVDRCLQRRRAAHDRVDPVDADVARDVERREPTRRERSGATRARSETRRVRAAVRRALLPS